MKILWVEDGGGNLTIEQGAIELFQELLSPGAFNAIDTDADESVWMQLQQLFKDRSSEKHQMIACKSYLEWQNAYKVHGGDFDVILIDINLEAYKTPAELCPIANSDFDKKAGLYIYNQLVKDGFPDDNIAFLTGEKNTLSDFVSACQTAFMEKPQHTFEKKPFDFIKIRQWLATKADSDYLILRRGIIEGCQFLKGELARTNNAELEERLLFHKTLGTPFHKIYIDVASYRNDITQSLTRLENLLPLRMQMLKDKGGTLLLFVSELVGKWELSHGEFDKDKAPNIHNPLENQFYRSSQRQLKLLRNWITHALISSRLSKLTEKHVAFFFLLTMRAWIRLDFEKIHEYEQILANLFK